MDYEFDVRVRDGAGRSWDESWQRELGEAPLILRGERLEIQDLMRVELFK